MTTRIDEEQLILNLARKAIADGWKPVQRVFYGPNMTACALGLAAVAAGYPGATMFTRKELGWDESKRCSFWEGFDGLPLTEADSHLYAMGQRIARELLSKPIGTVRI